MSEDDPTPEQVYTAAQRFGCGAILAAIPALVVVAYFSRPGWPAFGLIAVVAIAGGWWAVRGGDQAPFRMLEQLFRMLRGVLRGMFYG